MRGVLLDVLGTAVNSVVCFFRAHEGALADDCDLVSNDVMWTISVLGCGMKRLCLMQHALVYFLTRTGFWSAAPLLLRPIYLAPVR